MAASIPKRVVDQALALVRKNGLLRVHAKALRSSDPLGNLRSVQRNLLFSKVMTRTLVSYDRLLNTHELAQRAIDGGVEGSFVECGVWKGGVSGLMATLASKEGRGRQMHLFDSFEGCPQPTEEDEQYAREFGGRGDEEELSAIGLYAAGRAGVENFLFGELRLDANQVRLHQGWFQDSLAQATPTLGPIALLRIDADWYESVKCCLDHLYPLVSPGGFVILDDYGGYPGCKRAFEEYEEAHGLDVKLHIVDEYGAWFRKPT